MRTAIVLLLGFALHAQDVEKEKALGAHLAGEYRRTATVIDAPEVLHEIETLGNTLVPAGSRFTYTFALTAAGDAALDTPTSFPGGYVFVPSALILGVRNIDELAGMMAHAIAHVEARHGIRTSTRSDRGGTATIPVIFMGGWTQHRNTPIAMPIEMLRSLREYELEADALGARYMSAAGYAPERLADYIERTQPPDASPPDPRSWLPSRAARVAALRALPGPTAPPENPPDLAWMKERLQRALPEAAKAPPRLAR